MPTDIAKYSIELFEQGGEGAGIEEILDRHADLKVARSISRDTNSFICSDQNLK